MPWFQLEDANDKELDALAERYHLHPLQIQDCRDPDGRIKIEQSDDYHYLVLQPLQLEDQRDGLNTSPLHLFVGRDFCITIGDMSCPAIRQAMDRALRAGSNTPSDRLLYIILDTIVDSYFSAVDKLDDRIDQLEESVLEDVSAATLQRIFNLKRELIDLRRIIVNTRDIGTHLSREAGGLIHRDLYPFFRDVYDHLLRLTDTIETMKDLLNNTLDVYLTSVANRTNQVMKVLTVLSTVALPALVISGIYGMNLKGLPFLESDHGTIIVGSMMLLSTVCLLVMLRLLKWL